MRIGLLYNRDRYAVAAVARLLPELTRHDVQLFHSARVGGEKPKPAPLKKLQEYESELQPAGFDVPDEPLDDINQPSGLQRLAAFAPDLLISIRFGKILRPAAIASAARGVINLHSGLLPDYRGVMPTFWAMLNEAPAIGSTLHWITDASIDTGPAIAKASQPLHRSQSYAEQVCALYDPGVAEIVQAVQQIDAGLLTPPTASGAHASQAGDYYSFPSAEDCQRFQELGWRWLPD